MLISPRFDAQIDAATRPFKLGIFGGTFDPVHVGHLYIAECAREQFDLDGVLFIPTGKPAYKINTVSNAEDRYAMLLAGIAGNEHFDVSRIEMDRTGTTFTIDTLTLLKGRYGDRAELFFIVGSDTAADIAQWKRADEIKGMVTFLCAGRKISEDMRLAMLHNNKGFDLRFIDSLLIDVSSGQLRELVRGRRSIRYLVTDAVCAYISEQGLYRGQ